MARKVFYSFHYANDINRAMIVRNHSVTNEEEKKAIIDKAEFEKIKKESETAVKRWINKQLNGTSATVVLIGKETLDRHFIKYEIMQSIIKGNAIVGVLIHNVPDMRTLKKSEQGDLSTTICYRNGKPVRFYEICDVLYDYDEDDGYKNLGKWVEDAIEYHKLFRQDYHNANYVLA